MGKTIRRRYTHVKHNCGSMWEKAIGHLEAELRHVAAESPRAQQIRAAIYTFTANLKTGMPWPGKSATQS